MKRCPQCEFIYEDDQSLCDMDGVLLVFDSRTLPNLHALATVSAPLPGKTARRNRMVPAFATLILMLAVASVYYVSTLRNAAPPNFAPPSVSSTATEAPVLVPPAPSPAEVETIKEERVETPAPPAAQPASPVARSASPAAPPPSRKATSTTPATTKPAPRKEDSKVESIIKKTGKLLKKPFKF
jgi:hypothetical protein